MTPPAGAGSLNVKNYGAVGNGQADDTVAIQKALDAGAGKQVLVPAGTYKVHSLSLRTATTLNLDPQATLVLAPGSNADLITVTASGATVTGSGTLDGNRGAQGPGASGAGINVGNTAGVTIQGIQIVNTSQYGVYAANAANLTVSGISVSGTGYIGIFAEALTSNLVNLVIENSRVDRSTEGPSIVEGGIVVHHSASTTVAGVRISGNTVVMPHGPLDDNAVAIELSGGAQGALVQNNVTTGGSIGISLVATANGSVSSNNVSGANVYGIELASSQTSTLSANTVQCAGYTPEGIVLDNAPTDDKILGNTVSGCVSRGIALSPGSDRTVISNNAITQADGYAIEIVTSAGVAVSNNVLNGTGSAPKAITVETSPGLNVTGNQLSGFSLRGVLLYDSDGSTISGNQISETGGYAVHVMSTSGVTISDNTVDGANSALKGLVLDTSSNATVTKNHFSNFTESGVLVYGASAGVLNLISITLNTFSQTNVPYATQLSGGATLGPVVFSQNTTS